MPAPRSLPVKRNEVYESLQIMHCELLSSAGTDLFLQPSEDAAYSETHANVLH